MYCENDNVVGCSTCMSVKHSKCKDKFYVPDYVKNNEKATTSSDIAAELDKISNNLDELQNALLRKKEMLKRGKENCLEQIKILRKKNNQRLDELEENTVQGLDERFESLINKIDTSLRELKLSTKEVASAQDSLRSAGTNTPQIFVSIKMACDVASETKEKVNTTKLQVSTTEIFFDGNQKLNYFLETIQDLGSIRIIDHFKINDKKTYSVTMKSDIKTCSVSSACTLDDGTIILADYNNNKIKRLDSSSFAVRDCYYVPENSYQVCAIGNQEIAVTCEWNQLIQFLSIGSTIQKTRKISTDFQCRGLAYADGKLIVSDATSVYVYSVTGKRLKHFTKDQYGQQIFSAIRRLTLRSGSSKIYIADWNNGLIILGINGQMLGHYNDPELKTANGICLHKNGSVLVSANDSKTMLLFSPNGQLISQFLKTDTECRVVCLSKDFSKMIVGVSRTNEIAVYDII